MTDDRQGLTKMSDHAPAAGSRLYLWIHISRLAQRLLIQQMRERGSLMLDMGNCKRDRPRPGREGSTRYPCSCTACMLECGWTEMARTFASSIATRRCEREEPEEFAKLASIPEDARSSRATFLARWFPVPWPGEVSIVSWDAAQLREIGRWMASNTDSNSTAWPEKPPGWQESLRVLGGRKRKKGAA